MDIQNEDRFGLAPGRSEDEEIGYVRTWIQVRGVVVVHGGFLPMHTELCQGTAG
jgi:hypothetical protein